MVDVIWIGLGLWVIILFFVGVHFYEKWVDEHTPKEIIQIENYDCYKGQTFEECKSMYKLDDIK